jgi:molybdopterin converting factor small subunit
MPKVLIPTPLRPYVDNQDEVSIDKEGPISDVLASLISQYPSLQNHLYDGEGSLRGFINVYVNDEDIRYQDGEKTIVNANQDVSIVPSIAGGI